MSRRIPAIVLLMLLATALAACGSKGALVLPDQQVTSKKKHAAKPVPAVPAPTTPATPTPPASGGSADSPR